LRSLAEEEPLVALTLFSDAVRGILPAPLGVEAAKTFLEGVELLVIHVVVEEDILVLQLAHELYPGALGERHVEKAVEGLATLGLICRGAETKFVVRAWPTPKKSPKGTSTLGSPSPSQYILRSSLRRKSGSIAFGVLSMCSLATVIQM
jgi:hypothetical protein